MSSKEIVALDDWEHILIRPQMYVGSIDPAEERIPVIKDGKIYMETREISIGFYKMFHEILDNAVDEAKRMRGKMKLIEVVVDSSTNRVSVRDTGEGFQNAERKNSKTGKTNVETAMSRLRAGSNFDNDDTSDALIGTNGVGAAVVNVLSDEFSVTTINKNCWFSQEWHQFKTKGPVIKKKDGVLADWLKDNAYEMGTTVEFVPRKKEFKKAKWDRSIIHAQMVFKNYLIKNDEIIKNLKFRVIFDGDLLDLEIPFYPEGSFVANTKIGTLVIHESFDNSGSISFINSAMCTGIHQRIINEMINEELDDTLGHHFYENFISFNLPPKLVRFRDQNKTRLDSTRSEIEGTIKEHMRPRLREFFVSDLFKKLLQRVEERKMSTEVKKLRNAKKKVNVRNSPKYFPPSGKPENLFIVEGESAMGSILQKRNTKIDGVYRLKGKIKNVRSVSDLSSNEEVTELMQILDLDLDDSKRSHVYKRIIIATDADEDGGHITSLLVNLFFKWFPYIIDEGRLFRLRIPLLSVGEKNKEYFFDKNEFDQYQKGKRPTNIRFLKGLGSLSEDDWEIIMSNKQLLQIRRDDNSKNYLEMAFGRDSAPRKKWLRGEFN
jgi:DNA gyrase/topoisomerase IV subunit B